ncbi:MAG: ATP synthase subunit C [Angelakisella sp.]
MNSFAFFLLPLAVVVLLAMPFVPVYRGITTGKKARNAVLWNLCAFFGVVGLMFILPVGSFLTAAAETAPVAAAAATISNGAGMGFLAAALVTGLSCIGSGIAVAAAAPAAIGAFSEDPKAFGKALIFVVLGEGIAIYGLLISILIINKL